MPITLIKTKSCCSQSSIIAELPSAIKKIHMPYFKSLGYNVSDSFFNLGICYLQMGTLNATGSFGSKKLSLHCGGDNCDQKVAKFAQDLEKALETS